MAKTCKKCCEAINGIDVVVCRGFCGAMFHMSNTCSGVTRALSSYFATNRKNLFWMCDDCADLFENNHFRMLSRQADETSPLSSLTSAISELRQEIKLLAPKPTTALTPRRPRSWPVPSGARPPYKRFLTQDGSARAVSDSQVGSKPLSENIVSVPTSSVALEKQKFWLYISRIRPDVSSDSVTSMVKANLEIDDNPIVVKLIPRGMDPSTMNFVSFKIGIDPEIKSKALDPSTWPEGLLFREFEDYGTTKFRIPTESVGVTPAQQ